MKILVNGAWRETVAAELSAVLDELGYAGAVVTTAVNGEFVAAAVRPRTLLAEGDRVEVLAPMQGG
jgi:sulfur carrier protein